MRAEQEEQRRCDRKKANRSVTCAFQTTLLPKVLMRSMEPFYDVLVEEKNNDCREFIIQVTVNDPRHNQNRECNITRSRGV